MKTSSTSQNLHINPSLRLMVTFRVLNEETRSLDHHDYSLARYPEFLAILIALASNQKTANAFASAKPVLTRELESKGIVLLSLDDKKESRVIGLNPNAAVTITLLARYNNAPSTRRAIVIDSFKTASLWLLKAASSSQSTLDDLNQDDINMLSEQGALIERDPPSAATYPNPLMAEALYLQQLATAEQVFIQNIGDAIPEKVINLLGKQIPELPKSTIVWTCEAGTRLPNATVLSDDKTSTLIIDPKLRLAIPSVAEQKKQWQQKLSIAKIEFKRQAYAHLVDVISPAHQLALKAHVRALVKNNYFGPIGDGQVDRRMAIHNEAVTASIHHRLAKLVSLITGEELQASYAYLGCYLGGAVLERHVDRAQCQYNLSIVFDMSDEEDNAVEPWPIYLQVKNKPIAVNLEIGSGLLYRGTDIEHWREKLPEGHRAIVCFYHFVTPSFEAALI
ncbi:MAG: hypothetical protein P8O99_01525 [Pseudomonadales bacterium]|nr:hypothetical protein [Pseudomonadales bacterium]